jgi:hypothetical protein
VNPLTCQAAMHAASGYIKTLMILDTLAEPSGPTGSAPTGAA